MRYVFGAAKGEIALSAWSATRPECGRVPMRKRGPHKGVRLAIVRWGFQLTACERFFNRGRFGSPIRPRLKSISDGSAPKPSQRLDF